MLLDELKARMFKAMKAGEILEKEILRVALGEITTEAARPGRTGSDDEARAILRKLIKSNEETSLSSEDVEKKATLARENQILAEFLPKALSEDDVVAALAPISDALRAAGNDGQATGLAMKHLRATSANVDGKIVTRAVQRLRAPG
jgi:uncharacterized protein YqeY